MTALLSRHGWARLAICGGVSAVILVVGVMLAPARTAEAYLTAYVATLSVVLGALALIMIAHLTNATWFVVLRPTAERIVAVLPALAVLGLPLILGIHTLYPWSVSAGGLTPELRRAVSAKATYLNTPFFMVRWAAYWITWIGTAALLRRPPTRPNAQPGSPSINGYQGVSAAGLVLLAFTMTFASFDWIMSLTPAWYSTIYGVYWFAGGILGALALLAILTFADGARVGVNVVASNQLHAIGTLMFTFTLFWAYIAYAQLLIIWSADLPSEVGWYVARVSGGWRALAVLLGVGHFAIPFVLLLFRRVKRSPKALAGVGAWLLVVHYADSYWLVMPGLVHATWWGFVIDLAAVPVVVTGVLAAGMRRRSRVPVRVEQYAGREAR